MVVVAALAGVAWLLGLFSAEPEEVSLQETAAAVAEEQEQSAPTSEPTTSETTAPTETSESTETTVTSEAPTQGVGSIDGVWTVTPTESTFVGYRADSAAGLAVGRSPEVEGSVVIEESVVTEVTIDANLAALESDSSLRDDHLSDEGLETDRFPDSSFVLTKPIDLDLPEDGPVADALVAFEITGELTVKEVTQPLTINLDGTIVGEQLVIVGSSDIELEDFGATIGDTTEAVMEFSLVLDR